MRPVLSLARRFRWSASTVRRTRKITMTIARPTATSVTVIAMVKSASTQPATAPLKWANATRLMLTAFSMSSSPRRMPTAFRRVRTPKSPMANMPAAMSRDPLSTAVGLPDGTGSSARGGPRGYSSVRAR
jgi:hypothetical protein